MLDGLFMLLSLSALMAIASFLAGSLPLSFSLSQSQLRLISTIGMGVLVGTSLIVIIPEGVETLYSASESEHSHTRRSQHHSSLDVRWHSSAPFTSHVDSRSVEPRSDVFQRASEGANDFDSLPGPVIPAGLNADIIKTADPPKTPTEPGVVGILNEPDPSTTPAVGPAKVHRNPHAWIGISLILGFILMYLIDTLPSLRPTPPPPRLHNIYSLSDLSTAAPPSPSATSLPKGSFSTTLGLVIHAAADGIALGASSSQPSLSFIIFIAIMIHKAPAAFGLTSVLLKQGLGKRAARVHLLAFSLAAPLGALGTWIVVRLLGAGGVGFGGAESLKFWTGVLLLFSGGTFLYVAMHTMQEIHGDEGPGYEESHGNGYLDGNHGRDPSRQKSGQSLQLVMAAVAGMLLPLLTQIGHAH
ncbi:hypothetical protein MMC11_001486 [Xylographa trunciseda]|nr:hypothetical protein [Xylographa trunciseda]